MNEIKNYILTNWGGYNVKPNVEETDDEIKLMVLYEDHGDKFIIIRTKEGNTYEYGYYLNRSNGYWGFVRTPQLFTAVDKWSTLANRTFAYLEERLFKEEFTNIWFPIKKPRICSKAYAQEIFNNIVVYFDEIYALKIHYEEPYHKEEVLKFLKNNEIDTQDNLKRYEAIKWTSKIDGIDGIAGKRPYDRDYIKCDRIIKLWYNGRYRKLPSMKTTEDDYGCTRVSLNLRQYK